MSDEDRAAVPADPVAPVPALPLSFIPHPAPDPEPASPFMRAKLDADGVYWGAEGVDALAVGEIAAPDDCIRPGAYKWDAAQGCWAPLAPRLVKTVQTAPSFEQAFYDFLTAGADAPRVKAWQQSFAKTIDEASK